ncbi:MULTISPECIES: FHA domain-containing protein [unclassified Microbacterium]|uniref:FHA domain-containing protein n=1 Tax=unclassified Microbacterium TaxID=2609290 RepID=UPI00301734F6
MTTGMHVSYRLADADPWWVAADGGAVVLLAPAVSAATADAVWRRLGDGGIAAVLDALTGAFGTSLTEIPPFALAIAEAGGVRVAVRGAIRIVAGSSTVSGEGVATWAERLLTDVDELTIVPLGAPGQHPGATPGESALPLRAGVAPAASVHVSLRGDVPAGPSSAAPGAPVEPEAEHAPEPAAPVPAAAHVLVAAPVPVAPEPAATEPAASLPSVLDPLPPIPPMPPLPPMPPVPSVPPTGDATGGGEEPDEAAATVDPSTATDEPAWAETIARPPSVDHGAAPDAAEETRIVDPPEASPTETIVSPPRLAPAQPEGDHDGATISVAEARALRAEREGWESTDNVPPRRPARGRIVLSTGRVVELDRPVVIGRRPRSTRTSGAELPTLVAVDSPEQDISRSHIEIRAEGEHVLVTDLDTTNGTVLLRGGQDPVRLHPSEPTMVVTGDVLDLGDGVTVAFEDLP